MSESEEFKTKINRLFRCCDGKMSDRHVATFLNVSTADVRRFKKGKLPPRYRREEIFRLLNKAWVHYEGRSDEEPEICVIGIKTNENK